MAAKSRRWCLAISLLAAVSALQLSGGTTSTAAERDSGGWLLVAGEESREGGHDHQTSSATYGGVCHLGVKHEIAKDVYPRTIYYTGGARCNSAGKPAVVFQDAQVSLYRLPDNNLVDRGSRVREYTDWSISKGAFPGALKEERYRNGLFVELQTPDGSNCQEVRGADYCQGDGTPVVRCGLDETIKVS